MLIRRGFVVFGLLAFSLLATGSCSSTSNASAGAGPVARFNAGASATPDFLEVPFPSDAYLVNGKIIDPLPNFAKVVKQSGNYLTHELGKMNGFSRVALSLFDVDDTQAPLDDNGEYVSAKIDGATLPIKETDCIADGSSIFLIDLEATDPAKTRILCRGQFHEDGALSRSRPVLAIGPARGIVLAEGHKYATVLTSRVKDKSGNALMASADFKKLRDGNSAHPLAALYGDALGKVKAAIGGALAADKAEVVAIAPFTTNKMTSELYKMRDSLEDSPAPTLAWDAATVAPMGATKFAPKIAGVLPVGFTASLDDYLGVVAADAVLPDGSQDPDRDLPVRAHDKIAAAGTAVFAATNFLVNKGGYDVIDHATFAKDAAGNVIPAPDSPKTKIWVTFAIPTGPMPAAGFPVVILQHGLGGSRDFLYDMANVFCAKGWVTVAIDSVTFGARAPEAQYQKDQHTDYERAPGAIYKGPDGIADPVLGSRNGSFDLFGGLKNIGALRDQLREAAIDTAQLVRVLRSNPDLSPLKTGVDTPKIDPDRVAYTGDSLGGIEGALSASIEPNVKTWVLNVAGAGLLLEIGTHGPGIALQLSLAGGLNFGATGDKFNESHPLVTLIQTINDPGDAINYASNLVLTPQPLKGAKTNPRNILQIEVLYDELVSNESNEALARAAGYGLGLPNVGSNAGIRDLKNISANPGRVPLSDVAPDGAGAIHDTPVAGVTAVVIQTSPSAHGSDMYSSKGHRTFAIPYARFDQSTPFPMLDKDFKVRTSYREIQATLVQFIGDGFQGIVPRVAGFKPPIRDFDDDGTADDVDPDPNNPAIK